MKKLANNILLVLTIVLIFVPVYALAIGLQKKTVNITHELSQNEINDIESYISRQMVKGKIPGMAVAIIKGKKYVYKQCFGYSDINTKSKVTTNTLFELGSTSKAFTALGILKLKNNGLLKLTDPVKNYLPWFHMRYKGEYQGKNANEVVDITIEQLMHHTSGIPDSTINIISASGSDDALETTIRALVDRKLDFYPGEKYLYATINYDVLGLIIQKVTGQSFENYIKKEILLPLGLNNTYLFRAEAIQHGLAKGYKVGFLKAIEYNAPVYRGNTPAGYIITNIEDMVKWLQIQNGTDDDGSILNKNLILESHIPNRTVRPDIDGSSYAGGWNVFQKGSGEIAHGGSNPNYSSFFIFRPQDKIGVIVLSNMNSIETDETAYGLLNIVQNERPVIQPWQDTYRSIDKAAMTILFIAILTILITIYHIIITCIQIYDGSRKVNNIDGKIFKYFITYVVFTVILCYCLWNIPAALFNGFIWNVAKVWAPFSFIPAVWSIFIAALIFGIYIVLISIFRKEKDESYYPIIMLSVISGFGNAFIIYVINQTFYVKKSYEYGLILYFLFGVGLYVYGQKIVRTKMIQITNNIVYNKRIELINNILKAPFEKFEELNKSKIYSALNNDTETISNFAGIFITGTTSIATLICCFIFLGMINTSALLVSIVIISVAAALYYLVGRTTQKYWERVRDIQNVFFKFIDDLVNGYKELKINSGKCSEFQQDMQSSCEEFKNQRIIGEQYFTNSYIIGEILFVLVIGVVAFIFQWIFPNILKDTLRGYIFIFLYMTASVHGVLGTIPGFMRARISWQRLIGITQILNVIEVKGERGSQKKQKENLLNIELKKVVYQHKSTNNEHFTVGPVDLSFQSGEIIIITGGNGSGKTTLGKILTGLYQPDSGEILLNGEKAEPNELRSKYSTIFSDYYLFDKFYGIQYEGKASEICRYLEKMKIDNKLKIVDGVFSTGKFSTGQRKRIALIVSYLENKPICLFDEWAADQDPEFRKYFYLELLPEMKKKGKAVIVITHDDRFFKVGDKIVKMEMGKIVT